MKIAKFREMTKDDLDRKLLELQDSLLKLRVKIQTKQVDNTAQLALLRKDIARIKTLLGEMAAKGLTTPMAAEQSQAVPGEGQAKKAAAASKAGKKR